MDNAGTRQPHSFRPWESQHTAQHSTSDSRYSNSVTGQPKVLEPLPEPTHDSTAYNHQGHLVLSQHAMLLQDFLVQQQSQTNNLALRQIIEKYTASVVTVERHRSCALAVNCDSAHANAVHELYNSHRLALVRYAHINLLMINYVNAQPITPMTNLVTSTPSCQRTPIGILSSPVQSPDSMASNDIGYSSSPSSSSSCSSSPRTSPPTEYISLTRNDSSVSVSPVLMPNKRKPKRRHCNKALDHHAVTVLNSWYVEHENNPYPTARCISQMAKDTGLANAQIRKWLANRRLRSSNTYKKAGRMNPLRYQTIAQKRSSGQVQNCVDSFDSQKLNNTEIDVTSWQSKISFYTNMS